MSITNITFTTPVAGISQSTGQTLANPTTATIDLETFLVTGSIAPNNTADNTTITVTKSLIKLHGASAQIRYGTSSTLTTARLNVTDSIIQIGGNGASRVNNYFSLLRRGKIIGDTTQSGTKFIYTQGGGVAIIEDWDFIGIYCHEINGVFASFKNVTYSGTGFNILNWIAGDLSLRGITLGATTNAGGFVAWLGSGSSSNRFRFYDSSLTFTATSIAIQGTLSGTVVNKLFRYWSVTEQYQQGSSPIQDALVIYRSDQAVAGTQAEIARYTTTALGRIAGGRHDTLAQYSVDSGTTRAVAGITEFTTVRNYTITTVSNFREIRSYGHSIVGNNAYNLTAKIGDLDSGTYNVFLLSEDPYVAGISKAAALAYGATHGSALATVTGALDLRQVYASRKAYWRDTDSVLMGVVDGVTWDAGAMAFVVSSGGLVSASASVTQLRTSGSVTVSAGGALTAPLDGVSFINFASAADLPAALSISNSAQGLRITAPGTYDLSLWTFSGNTADVTVAATTGIVTVLTGGRPGLVINDLALGATLVRDDNIDLTVTCAQSGASLIWRNVSQWKNWLAEYASDVAAQAANPTPTAGDYYRTAAQLYGRWTGSAWITGVSDIDGGYYASTYLGGPGMGASVVLRVPPNSDIRIGCNWGQYKMAIKNITVGTSAASTEMVLQINPDIDPSYFPAAGPIAAAFDVSAPDSIGTITVGFPASANGLSELLSLAVLELIRDAKPSMSGGLTLNNPTLIEVSLAQVIFRDDTVRMVAAASVPDNTIIQIPLNFAFEGYTIDPNPLDTVRCTRVVHDIGAKNPTSATKILGRVAVATEDKEDIKNHVTAMAAAFS